MEDTYPENPYLPCDQQEIDNDRTWKDYADLENSESEE